MYQDQDPGRPVPSPGECVGWSSPASVPEGRSGRASPLLFSTDVSMNRQAQATRYRGDADRRRRRQHGTSLTEVLVTVAILTLGFVATVELQTTGLRLNHAAYLRTQAVTLTYQILDSMRANRDEALDGAYDRAFEDPVPVTDVAVSPALRDLRAWLLNVENTMRPYAASAAIDRSAGGFVVSIRWWERGGAGASARVRPEHIQFDLVAQL
jgi:type IV pilus assembly protein PilV